MADGNVKVGESHAQASFQSLGVRWTVHGGMRMVAGPDGVEASCWVDSMTLGWSPSDAGEGTYDALATRFAEGLGVNRYMQASRLKTLVDRLRWGERLGDVPAFLAWVWPQIAKDAGDAMEKRFGIKQSTENAILASLERKSWDALRDPATGESRVDEFIAILGCGLREEARAVFAHAIQVAVLTGYTIGTRETIASIRSNLDALRKAGEEIQ